MKNILFVFAVKNKKLTKQTLCCYFNSGSSISGRSNS